jgi:hypothetical protein
VNDFNERFLPNEIRFDAFELFREKRNKIAYNSFYYNQNIVEQYRTAPSNREKKNKIGSDSWISVCKKALLKLLLKQTYNHGLNPG